ncbi:hypothetical protein M0R19_01005 [Candidatus Pacearchaeota archaeon]|nr:hypothetical protein [Candidatus Pacearchaeota archaeon]
MNQKYTFLYALILTLVIFNLGIFMGYMLESSRIDKINSFYLSAEMGLLDQIIQKDSMEILNLNCDSLVQENIKFGDDIFKEAQIIQKYEEANRINENIIFQHKRFDLLRALFWINSIKIQQKCNPDYHNLVYLYKYNNPSIEQESKQKFFSNLLGELKTKFGSNLMLIPIAADNDISSIDLLVEKYNVNELPAILIDETYLITEVENKEDIEKYLV